MLRSSMGSVDTPHDPVMRFVVIKKFCYLYFLIINFVTCRLSLASRRAPVLVRVAALEDRFDDVVQVWIGLAQLRARAHCDAV